MYPLVLLDTTILHALTSVGISITFHTMMGIFTTDFRSITHHVVLGAPETGYLQPLMTGQE